MSTTIREDFDKLALLEAGTWNHNNHYHSFLLRHLPASCEESLEIGCGTGSFARLLAQRSRHVLALDLSPQMINVARAHSQHYPNIEFRVADALTWPFPAKQYDCIATIATMHHLPLEIIFARIKEALKPDGVLLVLDLFLYKGLPELAAGALAFPVGAILSLLKTGRLREPRAVREAWAQHGRNDHYLPVSSIRHACETLLPGARVRRHLLWRYSLIWKKPVAA